MKKASIYLAAIGILTLFALASVVPASADPSRYPGRAHWRHHDRTDHVMSTGPRRYFGGPKEASLLRHRA